MQIMFKTKASIVDYHLKGKSYPFPDLTKTLCPHCKKTKLKKHGFYRRYFISKDFSSHLIIRRHICSKCGKTVSSIPSFCHPRRTFSTEFIISLLSKFFTRHSTISHFLKAFSRLYGIECSRQLLYLYRKRFFKNLNFISMEIFQILSLNDFVFEKEYEKKARQVLSLVHHMDWTPLDVSIKLFNNSKHSYLTNLHFRV